MTVSPSPIDHRREGDRSGGVIDFALAFPRHIGENAEIALRASASHSAIEAVHFLDPYKASGVGGLGDGRAPQVGKPGDVRFIEEFTSRVADLGRNASAMAALVSGCLLYARGCPPS